MTDSVLVAALCARSPGALADLYDSYAESVYRYCRSMLATSDAAESALLGTFVAAEAHIHALADSRRLEAWLYALARGECVRRHLAEGRDSLVPAPVFTAGGDADLRVMAWNATRSLSADDREVLDLSCRHGFGPIDLAAVLGVTPKVAGALYESARERLRDVVTAEVLVRKGPYDCASRARMLTGFTGELTPEARERVIRHVNRCDTCAPHRVRQVSAAKVFDLLPLVTLPPTLRAWVMSHFTDPERVPYRRDVARLAGPLDGAGFPAGRGRGSRRPHVLAGTAAAVAAVAALALVLAQSVVDPGGAGSGVASGTFPAVAEPPDARIPGESRRGGTSAPLEPVGEGVAVGRIGSLGMTEPVSATGPAFGDDDPGTPDPAGPWAEASPRRPGDGSSGDGATDPAREGPSADGPADRPAAPAENPAPPSLPVSPVSPVSPVPPGSSGIGAPDRHPPSRNHHGHSSRRCGITHRPADPASPRANPGSPQADPAPPRANPRPPREDHRPPRAIPRPPRTDPEPPRANPRPSHTDPRRPRANPGHPRSGPRQVPDGSRPAPAGPGRTSDGAGRGGGPDGQAPERISNGSGHGRTPGGASQGRTPDGTGQGRSSGDPGRERSSGGSPSASTGTTPATPPSRPESPAPAGTAAIPA